MNVTESFEANRERLRGVAFRMLGSLSDADDAVQEAWLRLSRTDTGDVANLAGWLTTVVARVCLDMLRSRQSKREEPIERAADAPARANDPERELMLANSVGLAMLVVLDTLTPPERLAFVLHDLFGVAFDQIGEIVGRTPEAARQLASRARRRVRGAPPDARARDELARQSGLVENFIAALRAGDVDGLVALLDPELVATSDDGPEVRGARAWATGAVRYKHGAHALRAVVIDGAVGMILVPRGKLARAIRLTFAGDLVARLEAITAPERLAALELGIVELNAEQLD
jgi:RNA polymerase sigma factor (sigma-70 family)